MEKYKILTTEDKKRITKAIAKYLIDNMDNGKAYAGGIRTAWRSYGRHIVFTADLVTYAMKDLTASREAKSPHMRDWYAGRSAGYMLILKNI